ncbi:putative nitrate/TMAO reductase, membrane-bound tetraheme cytochrome c subunit [Magnetofaba australis IT-1]|uniref:Putative nitrate/TMAO reductase, membrane-bound tetraheme cytochrome c subunit n=2 Tax=Magnetofaba TaxID=1472292 RepID=A0A1Y2K3V7_9PROT|nr:putative nitrate/TMAO reductase, membrane-bound tetraheme cytochrome c subunit [Magnetofaba australis IT-1]
MKGMGARDPQSGEFVSLWVDHARFANSSHRDLACQDCHEDGYVRYPHEPEESSKTLKCLDCHDDNRRIEEKFEKVGQEFAQSVHAQRIKKGFNCFSCHNPHDFAMQREEMPIEEVIAQDNGFCLNCHLSEERFSQLTQRSFIANLEKTHGDWLPNPAMHWQKVRCIECHTPHTAETSHVVLSAKQAEHRCVACHSKDSILLTKLYKYRHNEQLEKVGVVNAALLGEAYIIGSTRVDWLDKLSLILVAATALGVAGHGLGRFIGGLKRSSRSGKGENGHG